MTLKLRSKRLMLWSEWQSDVGWSKSGARMTRRVYCCLLNIWYDKNVSVSHSFPSFFIVVVLCSIVILIDFFSYPVHIYSYHSYFYLFLIIIAVICYHYFFITIVFMKNYIAVCTVIVYSTIFTIFAIFTTTTTVTSITATTLFAVTSIVINKINEGPANHYLPLRRSPH